MASFKFCSGEGRTATACMETPMRWQNMPEGSRHAARFIDHIGGRRGLDDLVAFAHAFGAALGQQRCRWASDDQRAVQRHGGARGDARPAPPHATETSTFWMRMSARFSAAATASRMDSWAPSRLVTVPELMPWDSRNEAPSTFRFPGLGAADQAHHLRRTDIQRRDQSGAVRHRLGIGCAHADRFSHHAAFSLGTFCFSPLRRMKM